MDPGSNTKTPLRLLLVEDNRDDADLVKLELTRCGFDVKERRVETRDAFTAALREDHWDVVISDFMMPQFNGMEAFDIFRAEGLDIPYIFVSGVLGEERAVDAMRAGARDYLLKGNLGRLGYAVTRELQAASERRKARELERRAVREQRRVEMAMQASGAGVFELERRGEGGHVSARCAEILGDAIEEVPVGPSLVGWALGRLHPDDRRRATHAYRAMARGDSDSVELEIRFRHRDGHYVHVDVHVACARRSGDGHPEHVVGMILDQTERRRLETQLRLAQRMEAVGQLAAGVAHDFNNLLTAIFNFGEFVLADLEPRSQTFQDMQEVMGAAQRARALIVQMLAFTRQRSVDRRTMNPTRTIEDLERMLSGILGADVDLRMRLERACWDVSIDAEGLEQVVVNMVANARDALSAGGTVTIETDNVTLDAAAGHEHGVTVEPGDYVRIVFRDDGSGMDPETQRRIFEPFYTTKALGKGSGLGLATCYGIIKQAGGYIWVDSEPGRGTTFRAYLPRVLTPVADEATLDTGEVVGGHETILVAEDDDQVRRLATRALRDLGYRVIEAASGGEAVRRFEDLDRPLDLLLTDVIMPGLGGRRLADSLRTVDPELPVVYMSGYNATVVARRGVVEVGAPLLEKPFTAKELAVLVRRVLDRSED